MSVSKAGITAYVLMKWSWIRFISLRIQILKWIYQKCFQKHTYNRFSILNNGRYLSLQKMAIFSSLLFGSLCCSCMVGAKQYPSLGFCSFLLCFPPSPIWGCGVLSYLWVIWAWEDFWNHWGKEKKINKWRSLAGHLLHLLPCTELLFLIHFPNIL